MCQRGPMKKPLTRKNRKPIFVLIIPRFEDLANSFYAGEVTKGANIAASRLDVDILIHMVDRKDHAQWLEGLSDPTFIDGILFADIDRDWDVVKRAIKAGGTVADLETEEPEEKATAPERKGPPKKTASTAPLPPSRIKSTGPGPKSEQELAGSDARTGVDIDFNPDYEKTVKARNTTR